MKTDPPDLYGAALVALCEKIVPWCYFVWIELPDLTLHVFTISLVLVTYLDLLSEFLCQYLLCKGKKMQKQKKHNPTFLLINKSHIAHLLEKKTIVMSKKMALH